MMKEGKGKEKLWWFVHIARVRPGKAFTVGLMDRAPHTLSPFGLSGSYWGCWSRSREEDGRGLLVGIIVG